MMRGAVLVLGIALGVTCEAAAQREGGGLSVVEWVKLRDQAKVDKQAERDLALYLRALESGVFSLDTYLRAFKITATYCPPDDANFSWPAVRDLISRELATEILAKKPPPGDSPISVIYIKALRREYPCPESQGTPARRGEDGKS
jgi:hypothetical protein